MASVRCPECRHKQKLPADWEERPSIRCPECSFKIPLDDEDDAEEIRTTRRHDDGDGVTQRSPIRTARKIRDEEDDFEEDEEDEEEEYRRPKRKLKKKKIRTPKPPMPGLLIAMSIVGIIVGILWVAGGAFLSISLIRDFGRLNAIAQAREGGAVVGVLFLAAVITGGLRTLCGLGMVAGAIALLFRLAIGRWPLVYCPIAMFIMGVAEFILMWIVTRGAFGAYQVGAISGLILLFAVCTFFYRSQQDENVNRALR